MGKKDKIMKKSYYAPLKTTASGGVVKKSTQTDITSSTKVDPNVTPIKAVQVDVKKLTGNNIREIVNFDIDCSILSAKTNTITPTLSSDEEFDGSESNERIPPAVEKKIMESVNRRRLQCLICQRHFRRTHLVQQHVANVHLHSFYGRYVWVNFGRTGYVSLRAFLHYTPACSCFQWCIIAFLHDFVFFAH